MDRGTMDVGEHMIYDPEDVNMALREDLVLMYRAVLVAESEGRDIGEVEQWVPLHEIRKASNHPDDFTRPSW
jgi:hypothetical protein